MEVRKPFPEGSIIASSMGGGKTKNDISVDDSTAKQYVKFKLTTTNGNINLATLWKQNFVAGLASVIQVGEDVFQNMRFTGELIEPRSHEGEIEIKFEG